METISHVHCELKKQSEDKPDMTEVDTTYSWQMPSCVDAKGLCASVPVSSTNNIHADTGVSAPGSAFFVSGNTSLPQI